MTNICTDMDETRAFYEDVLGWHTVKRTQNYDDPGTKHYYFSPTPAGEPGTNVTYFEYPNSRGQPGPGASHHFAIGVEDEDTLREWREHLLDHDVRVSNVKDRTYFKSIYFNDPDGLVFEIATRGPGFTADEDDPGATEIDPFEEGYEEDA
ncbi:glyoxalase/bleomycin resistance protein/dioxygenase [Halogranum salarium B-1]|uniref:Glyoxalase/bleomycin resistance protein/dioxygenase n=1 Tax=Halogranum salarium B-1 TaxID=1210908 RepID=J3JI27_9EURY|nr:glyoxalase/bleomycin resistance protein/dioxygenase [Halogranum salarium B-1]